MEVRPVIWVISDGKAGHEGQSLGLAGAIVELVGGAVRVVRLDGGRGFFARAPARDALGAPDLVIGAGSRTHGTLRACGRRYGAKTVVLMRPAFGQYDLIAAPAHDGMRPEHGVVATRGALTMVRPSATKDPARGLVLVGGPSKHHGWDDARITGQIAEVVRGSPGIAWTLTTSRRTPASFLAHAERELVGVEVVPVERTTREWLLARYAECATVWVTEDSVSMVYEALTSGARVGLVRVPRIGRGGRVVAGIDALARDGYAQWHDDWARTGDLPAPPERLDEASRVARMIVEAFGLRGGGA